jgi:hypothetical protein
MNEEYEDLLGRLYHEKSFVELMMPGSPWQLKLLVATALHVKLRCFPRNVLQDFFRHVHRYARSVQK